MLPSDLRPKFILVSSVAKRTQPSVHGEVDTLVLFVDGFFFWSTCRVTDGSIVVAATEFEFSLLLITFEENIRGRW